MSTPRKQLVTAGTYVAGLACFIAGIALEFTVSPAFGTTLIGVGALLAVGARLYARSRRLPAP